MTWQEQLEAAIEQAYKECVSDNEVGKEFSRLTRVRYSPLSRRDSDLARQSRHLSSPVR